MRFDIVTIFPEYFSVLDLSLLGKAKEKGLVSAHVHNLRDWAEGKHLSVDHAPAGGGAGMVMRADVWGRALDQIFSTACGEPGRRILAVPSPSGERLTQNLAQELADSAGQMVFACGRYEGIDRRVIEHYRSQYEAGADIEVLEFSLGDYVLNGGEVACLTLIEAVSRLIDGMVGNPDSLVEESHCGWGALEYPVYTKPNEWRGLEIPQVLLGGNHALINAWRRLQSLRLTAQRRPDKIWALDFDALSDSERSLLAYLGYMCTSQGDWRCGFVAADEESVLARCAPSGAEAWRPAGRVLFAGEQIRLEIDPAFKQAGLERALLEHACEIAKARGMSQLQAEGLAPDGRTDKNLVKLFKCQGFKLLRRQASSSVLVRDLTVQPIGDSFLHL